VYAVIAPILTVPDVSATRLGISVYHSSELIVPKMFELALPESKLEVTDFMEIVCITGEFCTSSTEMS
jgi:hypothetical protein